MPQWAGSLLVLPAVPRSEERPSGLIDPEIEKAWMPVDLYVGGAEHAVLHLLYARFWHKVLFDRGVVSTPEPFQKLVNQGMILGENNEKMSKSRGNVINPDDVVKEYGADRLRLYEMFMGPLEATKPWSMEGVSGVHNFLGRAWRLIVDERADEMALASSVADGQPNAAATPHAAQDDQSGDRRHRQPGVQHGDRPDDGVHELLHQRERGPRACVEPFVLLLAPFAPHVAEELWHALGNQDTLAYEPWPEFDPALAQDDTVEIPVQINGKVKAKVSVAADADKGATEAAARADQKVAEWIAGKQVVKLIVVPGKLVNFVIKG